LLNVSASVLSSKTTPEESEDEESKDEATDSLLESMDKYINVYQVARSRRADDEIVSRL
jgi:hypothetical protein